jgi:chromosomal replication initiation ATPase DnaA
MMIAAGAVAVEDLHGRFEEEALFNLLNLAGERNVAVLLTSRDAPAASYAALPDLASRLRAAQPVRLAEPDDYLLRHVLIKLFADRQLVVAMPVIDYIVMRVDRSLAAANAIVDRLDRDALAEGRAVTRRLAAAALGERYDASEGAED